MENEPILLKNNEIKNKIYSIRRLQIMLDSDLAELYDVETKVLNQAVNRNRERFPERFMFQLTRDEFENLMSQFVTSKKEEMRSQVVTSKDKRGGRTYLPYVFTEQGVAMLSGVLRSETAIEISIQIIDAFIIMRKFIHSNAQIFSRIDFVEYKQTEYDQKIEVLNRKQLEHDKKFEAIFDAIQSKDIKPEKGIFFDGQIFDAYSFISDLIRTANKSIILIDNYIDDSVLTLFTKRNKNVEVTIFTANISKELMLDLNKYNSQYSPIEIREFKQSHDRFLIVDKNIVYHFGASLKDLGKKWFGFSKFDKETFDLLNKLGLK